MKTDQKIPEKTARAMQSEMVVLKDVMNATMSTANNVDPIFMAHHVDMKTGRHGIDNLIAFILAKHGKVLPLDYLQVDSAVELANRRQEIIQCCLTSPEVDQYVEKYFRHGNPKRYPFATIQHSLSTTMPKKNMIGSMASVACECPSGRKPLTYYWLLPEA